MSGHVRSKTFAPKEPFPADLAVEVLLATVLDHVPPQEDVVKELHVTNRALDVFLFEVRPTDVIPHERVPREQLPAVRALVARIVGVDQMLLA